MNELETFMKDNELPDIPESLKRSPAVVEKIEDTPRGGRAAVDAIEDCSIEIERQFVTVEEEGGIPVTHPE